MIGRMMRSLWLAAGAGLVFAISAQHSIYAADNPTLEEVRNLAIKIIRDDPPETKYPPGSLVWNLVQECSFETERLKIYAFTFYPKGIQEYSNRGLDVWDYGILITAFDGKIRDTKHGVIYNSKSRGCAEPYSSEGNVVIFFPTPLYGDGSQFIHIIDGSGRINFPPLIAGADQNLHIGYFNQDAVIDVAGWGLRVYDRKIDELGDRTKRWVDAGKTLAAKLNLEIIYPSLEQTGFGRFGTFSVKPSGEIEMLPGNQAVSLLEQQANDLRLSLQVIFDSPDRFEKVISGYHNLLLAYFGVLEAIGDRETILSIHNLFPGRMRQEIDAKIYADYWSGLGYRNLQGVFD